MKLFIDIPDAEYNLIKKSDLTSLANCVSKECMMHAIKTGIPLSDTQTNGDMIKAIFSNDEFKNRSVEISGYTDNMIEGEDNDLYFDIDWWNAPYNAEN